VPVPAQERSGETVNYRLGFSVGRIVDGYSSAREGAPQNWFDRVLFGHRQSVGILVHVPPEVHSGIHHSRYEVVADVRACGEPGATYGNLAPDN